MGTRKFWYEQAITLEDYQRREQAGQLTRPITDPPIGDSHTAKERRNRDAHASAAWGDTSPLDHAHTRRPTKPNKHTKAGHASAHARGHHTNNPHPDCPRCATGQAA